MRDGLPEAKDCMAELIEIKSERANIDREWKKAATLLAEAEHHFRKISAAREEADDRATALLQGVIDNIEMEIEAGKPSMWRGPVNIGVAA
jgi:hypothetical protein